MTNKGIVLGLLDTSRAIQDKAAVSRLREFTIAWSRYGYQGVIIERDSIDGILSAADEAGFAYCFIQPYGSILSEHWQVGDQPPRDFFTALDTWIDAHDFLVTGSIVADAEAWYGLGTQSLLVDLNEYRRQSAPAFESNPGGPQELPRASPELEGGEVVALLPSADVDIRCPTLSGWNFIRSSLEHGVPVLSFSDDLSSRILNLEATCRSQRDAFMRYTGEAISRYRADGEHRDLSPDQRAFLDVVSAQTANARQGVFLWNIESYEDVEQTRDDGPSPVSTLYSVAAGFKPNRILQTHGFTADTKVVFFDYSRVALDIKKYIVDRWDGEDFPRFVKHLFKHFPYPETFYQLWDNVTPNNVDWDDVAFIWERELNRWGGSEMWFEHWQAYRELDHSYVCCDIVSDPSALLNKVDDEPNAIIWWSNAFFTMYGNWFYTIEQRKQAYDGWIEQLARHNPQLDLVGSDFNNTSVNFVQAGDYWAQYRRSGVDCLTPFKMQRTEIRM